MAERPYTVNPDHFLTIDEFFDGMVIRDENGDVVDPDDVDVDEDVVDDALGDLE